MKLFRPVMLMLVVAAALALSACGGLSKTEYQNKVNKVMNNVDKEMKGMGNPDEKSMTKAADLLSKAADDLDAIEPPSDVKSLHEDLVTEVRDLSKLFKKMGPMMADAQDPAKAASIQGDLTKTAAGFTKLSKDIEETRAGFVKKGYTKFKEKKK